MVIKAQKGTKDILPQEISTWQFMEEKAKEVFSKAGFEEIRTPIFEATELFARGVGDTTDIVTKEMYTFEKSERSLTLRPENTAGVVRSFIENGMSRLSMPVKLWYKGPMFRYERPQAGRQRQFHQVGCELFGAENASADAEAILTAINYLKALGLDNLKVDLNSLGCPTCREVFRTKLKQVIKPHLEKLCPDCQVRYEKNPLRLLDCKVETCKEIYDLPEIQAVIQSDFICNDCSKHFEELQTYLKELDINYEIDKHLVRGLDYYNRTVFEIKSEKLGSQNAVCGGGRYDSLVENLGGSATYAVGWAMGMERLYNLMAEIPNSLLDAYVISDNKTEAIKYVQFLRNSGLKVDFDMMGKKFTKQLEKASKSARFGFIMGEDELKENVVSVKNFATSEQIKINANDIEKIVSLVNQN